MSVIEIHLRCDGGFDTACAQELSVSCSSFKGAREVARGLHWERGRLPDRTELVDLCPDCARERLKRLRAKMVDAGARKFIMDESPITGLMGFDQCGVQTENTLIRHGFKIAGELRKMSPEEISAIRGIGIEGSARIGVVVKMMSGMVIRR